MARPEVAPIVEEVYAALGRAWTEPDEDLDWPLLRFVATWASLMAPVDEVVSEGDRPGWAIVMDPATAPSAFLDWLGQFVGVRPIRGANDLLRRARIREATGFRRGTPGAIYAAAQAYLTGMRRVRLVERWEDDPYQVLVQTFYNETPSPSQTLQAILAQKPAGILLTYQVVEGATWADLDDAFTTFAAQDAGLGTFQDQKLYIP